MNVKQFIPLFIFTLTVWVCPLRSEVQCISNPTPTHIEKTFTKLTIVKEIPLNIDNEHFMGMPWHITADNQGNFFVFDILLKKIFKFDKNYKLVKAFGKAGNSPGEFGKRRGGITGMHFSDRDGYLYVADMENKRIHQFDTDGIHKNDFDLPPKARPYGGFIPVIDNEGNYFITTGANCTIDVFNLCREDGDSLYNILDSTVCDRSVILKVREQDQRFWNALTINDTFYDLLPDNRLSVYTAHASTVSIFEKDKLVKTFNVWPQKVLDIYRQEIDIRKKKLKENGLLIVHMFLNFFLNKDERNSFYLESRGEGKNSDQKRLLYQFDFEGRLRKVFYSPLIMRFTTQRNHLFYACSKNKIYILKEE